MNKRFFAVALLVSVMGSVSASTELPQDLPIVPTNDVSALVAPVSEDVVKNDADVQKGEEVVASVKEEAKAQLEEAIETLQLSLNGVDAANAAKLKTFCANNDCVAALVKLLAEFETKLAENSTTTTIIEKQTTVSSTTITENAAGEKQTIENKEITSETDSTTTSTESTEPTK